MVTRRTRPLERPSRDSVPEVRDLEERIVAARRGRSPEDAKLLLRLFVIAWRRNRPIDPHVMAYLASAFDEYLATKKGVSLEQTLGLRRREPGNPNEEAKWRFQNLKDYVRSKIALPRPQANFDWHAPATPAEGNLAGLPAWRPTIVDPAKSTEKIAGEVLEELALRSPSGQPGFSDRTVRRAVREVKSEITDEAAAYIQFVATQAADTKPAKRRRPTKKLRRG